MSVSMVLTQAASGGGDYIGLVGSKYGQTTGSTVMPFYFYVASIDNGINGGVTTAMSDAGQPIVFSTVEFGNVTGAKYDVYIVVERL
ncbi:MAG: hypothetical protein LAO03_02430 [Acidobacteriia bacterium]|nr:hypothetical protein [Terriglobia bacterium]